MAGPAGSGSVDIIVDMASGDFGLDQLNEVSKSQELFDVVKYPQATYKGTLTGFVKGQPMQVVGDLTLHGVTRPVTLTIDAFKCMPHPIFKREVCGADALGTFKRDAFGMPWMRFSAHVPAQGAPHATQPLSHLQRPVRGRVQVL